MSKQSAFCGRYSRKEVAAVLLSSPSDGIPPASLGRLGYDAVVDDEGQVVLLFQ